MVDYESMTIEELETRNLELSEEREQILTEQMTLNNVLNRKIAEQNAQAALEGMNDLDREALAEALK